jgi:uncharacterized protein
MACWVFEVMGNMRLDVTGLQNNPGFSLPFDFLEPMENLRLGGERMDFTEPVRVRGECQFTGKDFLLRGTIAARYEATCSRCACNVRAGLEIPFRAVFSRHPDPGDPDVYVFEGNVIDLIPMTADELIVNFPMRHLCGPDCRGLCPVCGADRNVTDCGCALPGDQENSFARRMDDMGGKGDDKEV